VDLWVVKRGFSRILAVDGAPKVLREMLVLLVDAVFWARLDALQWAVLLLSFVVVLRWDISGFCDCLGESLTGVFSSAFILPLAIQVGGDLAFEYRKWVGRVGLR